MKNNEVYEPDLFEEIFEKDLVTIKEGKYGIFWKGVRVKTKDGLVSSFPSKESAFDSLVRNLPIYSYDDEDYICQRLGCKKSDLKTSMGWTSELGCKVDTIKRNKIRYLAQSYMKSGKLEIREL